MEQNNTSENKPFIVSILEWVELFAVSVAIVMLVLVCLGRHSPVNGDSMNDTLIDKDLLIISDLFYTPKQGDIIVFESKKTTYEKPYVKRIIALENQVVDYNLYTGKVTVDGVELEEEYAVHKDGYVTYDENNRDTSGTVDGVYYASSGVEFPYTVPEGCVFVMGDNRRHSTDSRIIGAVDERCIIGKVAFRIFPFDQIKSF